MPDLTKLGFELMAFTTASFKVQRNEEFRERAAAWMKKHPNVLFASRAHGMGKDSIMITLHRDFADYERFMITLKSDWSDAAENIESLLVSLKGFTAKPFSFKYISEMLNP